MADAARFCLVYRGRECFLARHQIGWRILLALLRRPGCFVSFTTLQTVAWQDAVREDSTIRAEISRLRSRLKASGMGDLAAAIDGGVSGYVALHAAWKIENAAPVQRACSADRVG